MDLIVRDWLTASAAEMLTVALKALAVFAAVIVATRIGGLRSFSKMSAFDFAMTVAVGSLIATVAVTETPLVQGLVALAMLYLLQVGIAVLRRRTGFDRLLDNTPQLLLLDGEPIPAALDRTRVTESDLRAKLREANCLSYADARAVILETTGDITVLHGCGEVDPRLLVDVRGAGRLDR